MAVVWQERLAQCEGFQWDSGNFDKVWQRHRVTSAECEELFFSRPLIIGEDEAHAEIEERLYALGQTEAERLLFVVFTIRGRLIRVISARDMSRRERAIYRQS
jgi:uncharacterized DUF497 family protein